MNYPTINPFLSSATEAQARGSASTRSADLAAAQEELLIRRSDSPIANSPSKSSGSASVSGPSPLAKSAGVLAIPPDERANGNAPLPPGNGKDAPTDSISLAQLKQITAVLPKARQSMYTFPAPPPDSHTLLNEIEEFYSYVEVPQVLEHKGSFQESWTSPTDFCDTPKQQQLDHIKQLLEGMTSTDPDQRFTAARNVLYIAQGTFASSSSPENHLHLILSNVTLLREAGALQQVWEAVKGTGIRWEGVSTIPDPDAPQSPSQFSAQDRQEYLEEINGELAIHLAILYFMVEVFRGDESWSSELMQLEPPMPIYLFNLVAGLRERNAKGYPVKKLLLLLWKSILACIGGMKDIARVKSFVRDVEGLPPDTKGKGRENRPETKVAPTDYQAFRNEITSKYPSYVPPIATPVDLDRIAAAAAPTPIHSTFSYHINSTPSPLDGFPSANAALPSQPPGSQPPVPGGTPAPTPPASPAPKPKKQQFQTDQTRPFVLPFSPANAGPKGRPRVVPQSIDEAGELYRKNMRVSTELWQTWKLREEFMADESGITRAQKIEEALKVEAETGKGKASREELSNLSKRLSSVHIDDLESDSEEDDAMDPLSMLRKLAKSLQTEEDAEVDDKEKKLLAIRRGDVQRLERVEILYRAILPQMQSAVIVLLKLLLATVTANNNLGGAGAGQNDSGTDDIPVLGLEDTDIMRHREITSKAVSAILILTLKWFKTSHVMKFHYLSQLLVDSNCLLLILKMFGLQEVSTSVKTKNEVEDYNFFRYCFLYGSKNPNPPRPEDIMLEPNPPGTTPGSPKTNEDDVELISDYSWRNFFSVINFVHILQKLTKRKTHRVLLLVQYKSSAILKRILKVSHPTLQLYVLKVIKSQVPYCGRKWRQSNMKVITAIYLHCRPDLRDEWLTGIDVDADVEDSLPQEQALRSLVRFFNTKHYGAYAPLLHRRSSSGTGPAGDFHSAPPLSPGGGPGAASDDVFPPTRSMTSFDVETSFRSSYGHETSADDVGDYELEDLLRPRYQLDQDGELETDPTASRAAWDRLGDILGHYDDVSDSESVESLGLMRFARDTGSDGSVSDLDIDEEAEQRQARSDWVHMSPETITALEEERNSTSPRSPRTRNRRSSTGPISPALRPILIDRDDDTAIVDEMDGPVPAEAHSGPAVDEVELVYNI